MSEDSFDLPADLPSIDANETFRFACGPEAPCFNRCCAQLNLPLTPYDVIRLRRNLELPSAEFLRMFTTSRTDPETGLPMFQLRMIESVDAPCPFVTPAGCSVYEDRPGACRSYPLGRGARIGRDGVRERFFIVREEHCRGFDCGPSRTPDEWFAEEDMGKYIASNDRYMRLLSMVRASGKPLESRLAGMAALCMWQMDSFRQFVDKMQLLAQVEGPACENSDLMTDSAAGEESLLDLGLSWMELIIFGKAERLWRKLA